jgi:hypothetical protein
MANRLRNPVLPLGTPPHEAAFSLVLYRYVSVFQSTLLDPLPLGHGIDLSFTLLEASPSYFEARANCAPTEIFVCDKACHPMFLPPPICQSSTEMPIELKGAYRISDLERQVRTRFFKVTPKDATPWPVAEPAQVHFNLTPAF